MADFEVLRNTMVASQLIPRGIKDKRVLDAMRKVPRHIFISGSLQDKAYDDSALPIGENQTISQPYMVAIMTEMLELKGNEKVLEIGTGSGYQTAILAELAKEVFTIDRIEKLAKNAEEKLLSLGYNNIHVKADDGTSGWEEKSPFDRILITAGAPHVPEPLTAQLADNGIIIIPVGDRLVQRLLIIKKSEGTLTEEYHIPCVFVPLIGEYGWEK